MDAETVKVHYEIVWSIIADAFKYSKETSISIPSNESLMDFFHMKVRGRELDEDSSKLVLAMARIWGDFVGEPIEKQSLKFFWLEECIEGGTSWVSDMIQGTATDMPLTENLFLASTYKTILNEIARSGLAKSQLKLSTKVTSISFNAIQDEDPSATVTTASNEVLRFDEVIVTCPLGWLKRNTSSFIPALPTRMLEAIQNISYGRLEKVYLTFPKPFWRFDDSGDLTQPFFSNFLSPTYTDRNPKHWSVECVFLDTLQPSCAHPTLLFYLHGACAQHVTSLIDGLDPSSGEYHSLLNDFFAPYYARLVNYCSSSSECTPTSILATNWQNDEFSGWGSYTTFQTSEASKNVQLDQDIMTLREGCPDHRIWLAGEHTAPFIALGTTTGAYWSGQAVAERVADAYTL